MSVALAFTIRDSSGVERVFRLDRAVVLIGRGEANDIVLPDPSVSRRQARVERRGSHLTIENLSEKSPLYLNGNRRDAARLLPGDEFRLGDTEILLEVWNGDESGPRPPEERTARPDLSDAETRIVESIERARLDLLTEIVEVIPLRENRARYLERVLASLFRIMDLKRAFVALVDPRAGGIRQVASQNKEPAGGPILVSRAILNRVVRKGEGLLASNAMADPEFSESDSVVGEKIRSVICVPILRGEVAIGALYTDNRTKTQSFTRDDLAFLGLISRILSFQLENLSRTERLRDENIRLRRIIEGNDEIIGTGSEMRRLLLEAQKVAATAENVLITGETGSGKSLLARVIHRMSPRASEPFVEISCAAIPATLLEAELFGYGPKSGIAGADPKGRAGFFEAAGQGSILLDEIGDMARSLQAKILHAIEDGRFRRLGSTETKRVECRIIAATNQNLEEAVERGDFRKDLYYRIRVVPLTVPPLREHPEDIVLIVERQLAALSPGKKVRVGRGAKQVLLDYAWPGNVRELRNVLARALAMGERNSLGADTLRRCLKMSPDARRDKILALDEVQRRHMRYVLDVYGGNKLRAARALGISRSKLYAWLNDEEEAARPEP